MRADEYAMLSIADIQAGLASRSFTARELAEAALAAVARLDSSIHAFLELTADMALAAADNVDKNLDKAPVSDRLSAAGPLAGVPIAYKDNMNLLGTHTTCASLTLKDYISPYTATCVERTLQAGAIPLGKLNMDEFAFGSSTETSAFGRTYNPWDLTRVPGGSSGGSAAAVAAGMATVSLGSDTGGSVRIPASYCGVVGYKPSYGMVSRYGVAAFASSLDQVGPIGRSVADVAALTDAIAGYDPLDTTTWPVQTRMSEQLGKGIKGMRIAYVPAFMQMEGLHDEVLAAVHGVLQTLEDEHCELVPIELPHVEAALAAYYVIGPAEAFSNLSRFDAVRYGFRDLKAANLNELYDHSRTEGFGPEVKRRILLGCYLLSSGVIDEYFYPALKIRSLIKEDFQKAFEHCDALVTPVSLRSAFQFNEITDPVSMYMSDIFTIPTNIAGNGGMSLPVGLGQDSGLPIGVHIVGPESCDENIFRFARALEDCYPVSSLAPMAMQ